MRSACDQSTLSIDVQVFHSKARDPHVEAWRVGCHLSCPPRYSTEVPNHTVYERRVRFSGLANKLAKIFGELVTIWMFLDITAEIYSYNDLRRSRYFWKNLFVLQIGSYSPKLNLYCSDR
ncbi:hypothetical protein TNCV_3839861 [Trichonephila clavipes]|nr:hypothetical protein TNCV_3839861 [Trichonephila clavipes]